MSISKRLRFEILRRDNHQCRYCGASAPDVKMTVDHVIPVALGGGDEPSNLVAACADCNAGKSSASADSTLVADVAADAMRWAKAMQLSAEMRERDRELRLETQSAFLAKWKTWTYGDGSKVPLPADWAASFDRFIAAGLTLADMLELIPVAMGARRCDDEWAYFCGCAWNRVRTAQEVASQLLNGGING
jgi:hypothetical protein